MSGSSSSIEEVLPDEKPVLHIELSSSSSSVELDEGPARAAVRKTLDHFHMLYTTGDGSRPDLNAGKVMRQQGLWLNRTTKYFGHVPGIKVGDVFDFRMQLCVLGLHIQLQGGIAWIGGDENKWGEPVANSIVLSGGHGDEDSGNSFVYHGAGGSQESVEDQSLDRGNLALANAFHFQVPVRVIRGFQNQSQKKSYRYDGLYRVTRYWNEHDFGRTVYKFFLEKKGATFDREQVAKNLLKYRA